MKLKEKNIERKLWILMSILILAIFFSITAWGQLNPTFQSTKQDSLRVRQVGGKLWFTDSRGSISWFRTSGDSLYIGDITGEKSIGSLVSGSTVYASQGLTKDADTIKLGGEVGNVILSVQIDSAITIGDSSGLGVKVYNFGDTAGVVTIVEGNFDGSGKSSGLAVTKERIEIQVKGHSDEEASYSNIYIDSTGLHYDWSLGRVVQNSTWIPDRAYVDSVTNITGDLVTTVNITSSNILNGDSILILPAPGNNKLYLITDVALCFNYGTSTYLSGDGNDIYQQGVSGKHAIVYIDDSEFTSTFNYVAYADRSSSFYFYSGGQSNYLNVNSPVWIDLAPLTTGDGTAILKVYYKIVDFN